MDEAISKIEHSGILEFYRFVMDPVFDSMRENPRIKALNLHFEQWLESRRK